MGYTEPVVIQDKNGKTTTVHRSVLSPVAATINSSIPAPAIAVSVSTEISNATIISLLEENRSPLGTSSKPRFPSVYRGASDREVDDALDFMYEESTELFPLAVKLMTTGSDTGKELVKEQLSDAVNSIASSIRTRHDDPDWDRMVPSMNDIMKDLLKSWNLGNVAEEIGVPIDRSFLKSNLVSAGFIDVARRFAGFNEEESVSTEDSYWRGVAAFSFSDYKMNTSSGLPEHGKEFIEWAGKHADLPAVMRVVNQRNIIEPKTIEGILSQTNVEPALSSGIL